MSDKTIELPGVWRRSWRRRRDPMAELRHEGSYVHIHAGPVARTVQIRPDLHVDLAADGRVIGVERVGAPVSVGDLAAVLFALPLEEDTDA